MYPLYTPHTHNFGSVVKISPPLLLLKKTSCIIAVPGLLICLTVETSVDSFGHRRILNWRALQWLTTPNLPPDEWQGRNRER